jgi:biopolymer transport protein ExbB
MLTEKLMEITIAGGSEWVMVVLLLLSVASLTVIIERSVFFRNKRRRLDEIDRALRPLIHNEEIEDLCDAVEREGDAILAAAAATPDRGDREAREKIVASTLERERLRLERRLTFLGTLGNNAPFIGLFGTVLGIIRAFHDLSKGSIAGHESVMAGISEALVATAIGLFVAIPAVIAFNYFQKQVDRALSITESLAQGILATVHPGPGSTPARER